MSFAQSSIFNKPIDSETNVNRGTDENGKPIYGSTGQELSNVPDPVSTQPLELNRPPARSPSKRLKKQPKHFLTEIGDEATKKREKLEAREEVTGSSDQDSLLVANGTLDSDPASRLLAKPQPRWRRTHTSGDAQIQMSQPAIPATGHWRTVRKDTSKRLKSATPRTGPNISSKDTHSHPGQGTISETEKPSMPEALASLANIVSESRQPQEQEPISRDTESHSPALCNRNNEAPPSIHTQNRQHQRPAIPSPPRLPPPPLLQPTLNLPDRYHARNHARLHPPAQDSNLDPANQSTIPLSAIPAAIRARYPLLTELTTNPTAMAHFLAERRECHELFRSRGYGVEAGDVAVRCVAEEESGAWTGLGWRAGSEVRGSSLPAYDLAVAGDGEGDVRPEVRAEIGRRSSGGASSFSTTDAALFEEETFEGPSMRRLGGKKSISCSF